MPVNNKSPAKRELRELLLDAIEQVKDGTLDPSKASAVADLSQAVINADRFQLEAMEFAAEHGRPRVTVTQGQPLALTHDEEEDEPEDDEETEADEDEPEEDEPAPKIPPKASHVNTVKTLLKTNQPLELKEIARRTKIPQSELFKVLQDEAFERVDGVYWIAK